MTVRGHITAGDLSPIVYGTESTYGTAVYPAKSWGQIGEGGSFQPTDNPNPYLTWRTGSRGYSPADYVTQQNEAGYKAVYEVNDDTGCIAAVLDGAVATFSNSLPSRTVALKVHSEAALRYMGVKTDTLVITADAPGGVVKFEETALAADMDTFTLAAVGVDTASAVQWVGGLTLGGTTFYPQAIKLTIKNNLGRALAHNGTKSYTKALVEGRQEIEFDMDLWMEDLSWLLNNMENGLCGNISFTLGISKPQVITLTGCSYMADGQNTALVQDKQRQTVRVRAAALTHAAPSP